MGLLPILKPREVIAGLATTVPVHAGRDISPILLRQLFRNIRVSPAQFLDS